MIIDSLTNFGKYVALNPLFQDVENYLRSNDLALKAEGKDIIKGEDLFANLIASILNGFFDVEVHQGNR